MKILVDMNLSPVWAPVAEGPSVIQVRAQDVLPAHLEPMLVGVLRKYQALIEAGALAVVDEARLRVRVLPLSR